MENEAIRDNIGTRFNTATTVKSSLKVFAVFLVAYMITWGGHYTTGDGSKKIAWAKELLAGQVHGGTPPTSKYGIGHTLIAMPAMAASAFIQRHTGVHSEAALYTLIFILNGALLPALISYYLFQFYSPRRVWITVALIGFATTWWPYTKQDFSEVLVTTAVFAGFVLMRFGRPMAGMFVAAFSLTIRIDSVVILALLALWALYRDRRATVALQLVLGMAPAFVLAAAANYIRYHSIFDHGYEGEGFTGPLLTGLYGILFSAGKSIFLFSPVLILGFLGWQRFFMRKTVQLDAILFIAVFTAEVLLYSKWWDWSSDDAWGVRFLIPAVMLMCIPSIEILERRLLLAVIAAAGVWVQLLAVFVGGLDYVLLVRQARLERAALFVQGREQVDIEDMRFNPNYSQLEGNWILVRELLHIPPSPSSASTYDKKGTPLYDTLPPDIWADAAHWDFVWMGAGRKNPPQSRLGPGAPGDSRIQASTN